jgi:hypothetical protein
MRYYITLLFMSVIVLYFCLNHSKNTPLSYYRFDNNISINEQSIGLVEPFKYIFQKYGIKEATHYKKANVLFFTLLTDYMYLYPKLLDTKTPSMVIYSLRSIDQLANKAVLHAILSMDKIKHIKYTPLTYILNNKGDFTKLLDEFDESKLYILKKNIQRQKGCTITNNMDYISTSIKNKYVVCQELLQNPFLIRGHKINIRCYMVIIAKRKVKFVLYNNGFMYYTPKKFIKDSIDKDRHITTGYIDRSIYEKNPLTIKDLYNHLGEDRALTLKTNITEMFKYVSKAYEPLIIKYDSNKHVNFVILGCDVAVDDKLGCKIMEINKGPDLSYKDEKDKAVKMYLVKDTMHKIGLIHSPNNNFIDLN